MKDSSEHLSDNVVLPSNQDATGRSLGADELAILEDAISSSKLTSTKGTFVKRLEQRFAEMLGVKHAIACASGSAAIHCAIAASARSSTRAPFPYWLCRTRS